MAPNCGAVYALVDSWLGRCDAFTVVCKMLLSLSFHGFPMVILLSFLLAGEHNVLCMAKDEIMFVSSRYHFDSFGSLQLVEC